MRKKVEIITCDVCGKETECSANFKFFHSQGLQYNSTDMCDRCAWRVGSAIAETIDDIAKARTTEE